MKKLSIVVPVYYNQDSLSVLFERFLEIEQQLKKQFIEMELIFVDDGSGDESLQRLLDIKKQHGHTTVIKHTRNFGAVHATKTGFQFATGDCCVAIAADLQEPPELILKMISEWLNGSKFVICVRNNREDPFSTRIFAKIYYFLLKLIVQGNFPAGGYSTFLVDKQILPYLQQSGKNLYINVYAYWLGFQPTMIFYDRQKRIHGSSKWTFAKKITAFLDALLGFSIIPIRLISAIGFTVSAVSFVYGLWIFINGLIGTIVVQGFATVVTLISFLLGLIIVMLGIIGEYLWRTFDEVNKRPESVIDEIYD
jgi:dolichol-phosphate mannosyltransferase